jgi:phage recombination protein Bet
MEMTTKNHFGQDELKTLFQAGVIPQGTPAAQVELFAGVCKAKNLNPFTKEVYLVGYGGKYSIITGIEGFRKIAGRTGQLAGVDDTKYDLQPDGSYKTAASYKAGEKPQTATVTVYRVIGGVRCPFTHTAVFSEFAGSGMWGKMPFQMISKVAESFALRKAFGGEFEGMHIAEEVEAIQEVAVVHSTKVKPTYQKQAISPESPRWEGMVLAIKKGEFSIEKAKEMFDISPADLQTLKTQTEADA